MADRNAQVVSPEIRVARLLLEREGLQPPVPVHDLLAAHAVVERAAIPGSVDGLVYRPTPGGRPRVILSSRTANQNRERFTVAHELGHIILPWQTGAVFCHTEETLEAEDSIYREIEAEANRFAGELLVPMEWARSALNSQMGELATRVVAIGSLAEVSPMVAAFSVANVLDGVIIFVTRDDATMMSLFGSVLGRWGRTEWSPALESEYRRQGAQCSSEGFGPYVIHCVEFQPSAAAARPKASSTEVLDTIIRRLVKTERERLRLLATVNGVVGSANTKTTATTVQEFMVALQHRFADRPRLGKIVRHPRFEEFLLAKSYELADKRRKR